jgi:hypothetical protein
MRARLKFAAAFAAVPFLVGSAGAATAQEPEVAKDEGWYAVVDGEQYSAADITANGITTDEPAERPDDGMIQPYVYGPVDSYWCDTLNDTYHMVTNYDSAPGDGNFSGGEVRLYCGTNTSHGYKHIRYRHKSDWQNKMNSTGGAGAATWDDFMDFAVFSALDNPNFTDNQGNGKTCYTTPIHLYNDGAYQGTMWPSVVISRNNRLVITAFPGGKC